MKCFYHPEKDAIGFCENCGKGICEECSAEVKAKRYCYKCMKDILESKKEEKPAETPKKKKKAPKFLRIIANLMIIGGILSLMINGLTYLAVILSSIARPQILASFGMFNVQIAIAIIYSLLVIIAGKKLKNLEIWGFRMTLLLTLVPLGTLVMFGPSLVGASAGSTTFQLFAFIIADLYLIKNRKLFKEKKKDDKS